MNGVKATVDKINGIAARVLPLTMAGCTAVLVLLNPSSLAARIAGDTLTGDVINMAILVVCVVGWADVIWHDIRGRLIWPTLPTYIRHRICVGTYSALAGLTGVRAFVAASSSTWEVAMLGGYYVVCAAGIGTIAVAIALDPRHGTS